jgi:hypothetical protein
MDLQADEARKAIVELPVRLPKRARGYIAMRGYTERQIKTETTVWMHSINGDPVTGKEKRLVRRELGLAQAGEDGAIPDEGEEGSAPTKDAEMSELEVDVKIENPAQHAMPRTYLDGLSDVEFTPTGQAVRGMRIVTRWEINGTHAGELLGVPATRMNITITGITMLQFDEHQRPEGGRDVWATDEWTYWDLESVMEQLGLTP